MLRPREIPSTQHLAGSLLSSPALAEARFGSFPVFQHLEVKLVAPFGLQSSISYYLLPTQLNTLHWMYWLCIPTVSPHCTCWQLKLLSYTHGEGNIGKDVVKMREDGGL